MIKMAVPIPVLVVDDHLLVRSCVKAVLSHAEGIRVVGEASSGQDALRLARETRPTVVVMDLMMPGLSTTDVIHRWSKVHPEIKVVVLTASMSRVFPKRMLDLGVKGYLTKSSGAEELIEAVHRAARNELYLAKEIAQELALSNIDPSLDSPINLLSNREFQIMTMLVNGYRVEYIASKLCLSTKTVSSHRYAIFAKLGVHSDVELTHLAIEQGLIDVSAPSEIDEEIG